MNVLIADEDAGLRDLLRTTVAGLGYQVVVAESGTAAWEILRQPDAPPMAILEGAMDGMTGLEICRKVRELRRELYTYILLMTSKNSRDELMEWLEAGADDYLVKPFQPSELEVSLRAGTRIIELQLAALRNREKLKRRDEIP